MPSRILTPQEIAIYAYRAGFRGTALNTAVAIAMAESGGNPAAYNPESAAGTKSGSGSRGLWQIYGTAHPWANNPQVFDPQANANAAFRVFKESGGSFRPWSTYNQGLAKPKWNFSNMKFGNQPQPKPNLTPTQNVMTSSGNPFSGSSVQSGAVTVEKNPLSFLDGTPLAPFAGGLDNQGRDINDLSMYIGGVVLIVIGVVMLFAIGGLQIVNDNKGLIKDAAMLATGV